MEYFYRPASRRAWLKCASLLLLPLSPYAFAAGEATSRTLKILVHAPAGTGPDVMARLLALPCTRRNR